MEPQLEENLESFFAQRYPAFEVLFAVDHEDDAAIAMAERVWPHPKRDSRIVFKRQAAVGKPPAYSSTRMAEVARGENLVTSDSDGLWTATIVPGGSAVAAPKTGMLTCVFRGLNRGGFWSGMDAIGMSVEMTAGVVIAN